MDWFRRNWPDLLIGIALVAVIAAIVVTLITGGSLFPTGPGLQASTRTSTPTAATTPATPTTADDSGQAAAPAVVAQPAGDAQADVRADAAPVTTEDDATTGSGEPGIAALPLDGSDVAPAAAAAADDTLAAAPAASANPADVTPTTEAGVGELPSAAPTAADPFRVSVGAFGSIENAERQAARFREAGYPVFIGTQDDLFIVLVGPYPSEAQADQTVGLIRDDFTDVEPIVYRFQPDDLEEGAGTGPDAPLPSVTTAATTLSPAETTPAQIPTASSSGRFLQVGAYNSVESSQPQRQRVEGLGFTVSQIEESGYVKLLVGPFDTTALQSAQVALNAQGIDHFVR